MTGFMLTETAIFGQESYLSELLPGTESSFQHLNLESSKITGKSHFRYETLIKEGTRFVVEKMKTQRLMAKFLPGRRSGLMQIPVFQNGMRKRICERSSG
jgi:hypothetical protein